MAGGKTLPGGEGDPSNDVVAAIDAKQSREEHWRRAGEIRETESDPPRGAREPGKGERRPPSPLE